MALDARRKVVLWTGEEVRRSYMIMERSIAVEARIDVSVWLNATDEMVSTLVGQCKVCDGVEEGRERS
jgi:hypothetical protein